jgi:hypothetical protein
MPRKASKRIDAVSQTRFESSSSLYISAEAPFQETLSVCPWEGDQRTVFKSGFFTAEFTDRNNSNGSIEL